VTESSGRPAAVAGRGPFGQSRFRRDALSAGTAPSELRKDGTVLAWAADLDSVNEGWKLSGEGLVLVKLKHG